jgi:signal transduction histidine kinase
VINISQELPVINADPMQIKQVFNNIISNAIQAMTKGGSLEITCEVSGDKILISFKDNGEGISEENMGKMFQPLYTTKAKGIGLGMTICKNLIEANGGNIDIKSKLGVGTTVVLTF